MKWKRLEISDERWKDEKEGEIQEKRGPQAYTVWCLFALWPEQ